jgi:multiple sugar transport system substrate-binding protein
MKYSLLNDRTRLALVAVTLAASLAQADAGPDAVLRPATGQTEITFWHAMGGPLGDVLNSMIQQFQTSHPDIKITAVNMGEYSSLSQKLMSALWVKSPPVIAQVYESWATQFYEAGELTPIESLLDADPDADKAGRLADLFPALIDDNSWDGRIVTYPFNKSVPVYFYNKRRFDSLGIRQFPATWSEFRRVCKMLTRRTGDRKDWTWGTAGGVNAPLFVSMVLSHNGELMDEKTGRPLFASDAAVEVLEFLTDMILKDSSQVFSVGYSGQDDLLAGRLGMVYGSIVSKSFMRGKERFPISVAPLPYWDKPAATVYGTNIALFRRATAAQKAAAWEFIKWFTEPEQQAHWAARTFYVPSCRSALSIPEYAALLDSVHDLRACVNQMNSAVFEPKSRAWFEGRKIMDSGLEPALRGNMSPRQSLTEAAALMAPTTAGMGKPGFFVLIAVLAIGAAFGLVVLVRRGGR